MLELSRAKARFIEQEAADKRELDETLSTLSAAQSGLRNSERKDLSLHTLINHWNGTSSSIPVEEFLKRVSHAAECGEWSDADCVMHVEANWCGGIVLGVPDPP